MGLLLLQGSAALNPRELFSNNEQGLWLDPSQMSTLYQDSNGVTPCTAAGDPVGLILDQSRGGLGALGPELITSGDGTSLSGWVAGLFACTSAVSGGEFRITHSGTNFGSICFPFTTVVGRFYRFSATYVGGTGDGRVIKADSTNFTNNRVDVVGSQTVMTPGTSTIFFQATATTTYVHLLADNSAGEVSIYDNISVREVPGNHAYQTTSAARPTLQTSGGLWYLSFDGSDDSLVTNAVDFSATDEMTVIAGVRKLSDAARGTVCELTATSASNNGAFHLTAPNAASATYAFESKGTLLTDGVASSVTAPLTSVISGSADISADTNVIRVNGSQSDSDTGDQGTGNYSNAAIYIGRRGSSSLPFNGHLYQLIIRGKTTPTGKLLEAERFVGRKTGVSF